MKYEKVAVGGSFDVIHKGHEALLGRAFEAGDFVLIGLASSEMVKKDIAPYKKRKGALESFLSKRSNYEIVKLENPMGNAATDAEIDAIVVAEETERGAGEINDARKKRGLGALDVLVVPLVMAGDKRPISSRRIRAGEIDRQGRAL